MAFPETQRFIYENNILEQVKCEIRFPTILTIDAAAPAAFQEAVRDDFPYLELKTSVGIPAGLPANVAQVVERDLSLLGRKSYAFISEDRSLTLSLSKEGLSLTGAQYQSWEPFRAHLVRALKALDEIYKPSFLTHTCVRYKNVVRRTVLGLEGRAWSDLLQPWIIGPFARPETVAGLEVFECKFRIPLPDSNGKLDAACSLGMHHPTKELAFIVESHVFDDARKAENDVIPRLDTLHEQAGRFFRWCITDELHGAMRPNPI